MKALLIKILIGCILTAISFKYAYIERGYQAYGGEWLVLPTWLLLCWLIENWINEVKELRKDK